MHHWNQIIDAAIKGTNRGSIQFTGMPAGLSEATASILSNKNLSKEEQLLQIATLAQRHRRNSITATPGAEIPIHKAPEESLSYCSDEAMTALNIALMEDAIPIIKHWMNLCLEKQQSVQPQAIPAMLNLYHTRHSMPEGEKYLRCCGNRGDWLGQFNTDWNYSHYETWIAGDRKESIWIHARDFAPSKAAAMLQGAWPKANKKFKLSYLELLEPAKITEDYRPLLLTASKEKDEELREQATFLLGELSTTADLYTGMLKKMVTLQKGKLHFAPPFQFEEELEQLGLEMDGYYSTYSPEEYIYHQLVGESRLSFWENDLALSPESILKLLSAHPIGRKVMEPFAGTAIQQDKRWLDIIQDAELLLSWNVIWVVPKERREKLMVRHFETDPVSIKSKAFACEERWGPELGCTITDVIMEDFRETPERTIRWHFHLFPEEVIPIIEKYEPQKPGNAQQCKERADLIKQLLKQRKEIDAAFPG